MHTGLVSIITPAERAQAAEALEAIRDQLGQISNWLSMGDQDRAAILLEDAWRDISAACWVLDPPVRHYPKGWLSPAAGNGHGTGDPVSSAR